MSVKTINNITNNFYSDEWYTSEVTAKLAIEKLKIGGREDNTLSV